MQINQIKPKNKLQKKKRIGRGGKRGTYSGRGQKGQKSRAGAKIKSQVREAISKFPKKRGVHFVVFKKLCREVQLKDIVKAFPKGGNINPKTLKKAGLISKTKDQGKKIKILGTIPLSSPYIIKNCLLTQKASKAIIEAGGKIES